MNTVKKSYTVVKIERLFLSMYRIELEPVQPVKIDIRKEQPKPESDEDKYVLRMMDSLQKYRILPGSSGNTVMGEQVIDGMKQDNNLQLIVNTLDFNVDDVIELTIERVSGKDY